MWNNTHPANHCIPSSNASFSATTFPMSHILGPHKNHYAPSLVHHYCSGHYGYGIPTLSLKRPGLDHIFIRIGPAPPTSPSLLGLLVCTCVGNQCDNTRLLKPLNSFGMWRSSINKLGNTESDVNLNICNFDQVLSHWFPMRKSSHTGWGRSTG